MGTFAAESCQNVRSVHSFELKHFWPTDSSPDPSHDRNLKRNPHLASQLTRHDRDVTQISAHMLRRRTSVSMSQP